MQLITGIETSLDICRVGRGGGNFGPNFLAEKKITEQKANFYIGGILYFLFASSNKKPDLEKPKKNKK